MLPSPRFSVASSRRLGLQHAMHARHENAPPSDCEVFMAMVLHVCLHQPSMPSRLVKRHSQQACRFLLPSAHRPRTACEPRNRRPELPLSNWQGVRSPRPAGAASIKVIEILRFLLEPEKEQSRFSCPVRSWSLRSMDPRHCPSTFPLSQNPEDVALATATVPNDLQ